MLNLLNKELLHFLQISSTESFLTENQYWSVSD